MSTPQEVIAEVTAVNQAYYAALEAGDLDAMEALWLEGPAAGSVSAIYPGSPAVHGRREVLRTFAVLMANTPYIQFILTDLHVAVAGDTAFVSCTENVLTPGGKSGAVFAAGRAVATKVFLRVNGKWRLWQHHASPVVDRRESTHDGPG